jgi:hypothetical protein
MMAEQQDVLAKPLPTPVAPTGKGRVGFKEAIGVQQPFLARQAEIQPEIAKAEADIAKGQQEQKEIKSTGELSAQMRFGQQQEAAMTGLQEKIEKEPLPAFIPSKDTAQDIAGLFGVISVISMLVGGGGRMSGQLALGNMNGMMEGYRKGRKDLYEKERSEFDKNFKSMIQKHAEFRQEMEDAVKLAATNKEEGFRAAEMAAVKAGSPIVQAMLRRGRLIESRDLVKESGKGAEHALQMEAKAREQEEAQKFRREQAQQAADLRRDLATIKSDKTAAGKALTDKQSREIEGLDSLSKGLEKLRKDFKPEFASLGVLGFGADMEFEAKRRLGNKKGQEAVSWWSSYERLQAPNRHALFGATLTGNELKNYQSFTAKKSDSPETVKTFLDDQIAYSNSVGGNKRLVYEAAGYKVPEAKARDFVESFSTQPSKYSVGQEITQGNKKYRVVDISNPDDPEIEEIK